MAVKGLIEFNCLHSATKVLSSHAVAVYGIFFKADLLS